MRDNVEMVEIGLKYEVQDIDELYEAAKQALERLRSKVVAEYGESEDRLYAQPIDDLIKEHLHPDGGEAHLASCIMVILDDATFNVPGTELIETTAGSVA